MHAFLFIGDKDTLHSQAEKFVKKNNFNLALYKNIQKVEEVRELIKDTNLKFSKPTLYILEDFDKASEVAQNSFLKRLEEPGKNLNFLLLATTNQVLPTIQSRCQVTQFPSKKVDSDTNLLTNNLISNLKLIDKIKTRDEARDFLDNNLSAKSQNKRYLREILETMTKISSNANVSLHLTNLVISLDNIKI